MNGRWLSLPSAKKNKRLGRIDSISVRMIDRRKFLLITLVLSQLGKKRKKSLRKYQCLRLPFSQNRKKLLQKTNRQN